MLFIVLGALVVGLSLGLLGSGGSILTVPVLLYLLHHPGKAAITESLAIVGLIAFVGMLPHAKEKAVDWKLVLLFGLPGMAGTYLGSWLGGHVSEITQLLVFGLVMLAASVMMWRKSSQQPAASGDTNSLPSAAPATTNVAFVVAQGVFVGIMTGFVGVGGGFLIVPALVLLAKLPMRRAVATSLVIITLNAVVGFFKSWQVLQAYGQSVDWSTVAWFAAIGSVASLVGRQLGGRIPQAHLQRAFAVFLLLMGVLIATQQMIKLTSAR